MRIAMGRGLFGQMLGCVFLGAVMGGCGGAPADSDRSSAAVSAVDAAPRPVTRVVLSPEATGTAEIRVQPARAEGTGTDDAGQALQVPGQVELDPRRVAVASSRVAGRLEHLYVVEGDDLLEGQPVASLFSTAFLGAQSDLQQAANRKRLLRTTPDSLGARALADAAARRLVLMGATDAEVAALGDSGPAMATLTLRSPLRGSVLQSHVLAGTAVEAGAPVLTVADLTVVDVVAEVPEVSLPLVRVGERASIGIAAFPNLRFAGTVERLRNTLNPETRTVRAVIHVPNSARVLRPGMYATVTLAVRRSTPSGQPSGVLVPETAIVSDGADRVLFVEVGPNSYERRNVKVESLAPAGAMYPAGRDVRVLAGVRAGERVVVQGAFILKSELAKGAREEDK